MRFFVVTLDGTRYAISAEKTDTIAFVKEQVHANGGPEPRVQRLIFCGQVCQDDSKIEDIDISVDSAFHLVETDYHEAPKPDTTSGISQSLSEIERQEAAEAERIAKEKEEQAEAERVRLTQRVDHLTEAVEEAQQRYRTLEGTLSGIQEENTVLRTENTRLAESLEAGEKALQETAEELACEIRIDNAKRHELQQQLNDSNRRTSMLEDRVDTVTRVNAELQSTLDRAEERVARLRREAQQGQQQISELHQVVVEEKSKVSQYVTSNVALHKRVEALTLVAEESRSALNSARGNAAGVATEMQAIADKLKSVEEDRDSWARRFGAQLERHTQMSAEHIEHRMVLEQSVASLKEQLSMVEKCAGDDVRAHEVAVKNLQSVVENMGVMLSEKDGLICDAKQAMLEAKKQAADAERGCKAQEADCVRLDGRVRELEAELKDASQQLGSAKVESARSREVVQDLEARLASALHRLQRVNRESKKQTATIESLRTKLKKEESTSKEQTATIERLRTKLKEEESASGYFYEEMCSLQKAEQNDGAHGEPPARESYLNEEFQAFMTSQFEAMQRFHASIAAKHREAETQAKDARESAAKALEQKKAMEETAEILRQQNSALHQQCESASSNLQQFFGGISSAMRLLESEVEPHTPSTPAKGDAQRCSATLGSGVNKGSPCPYTPKNNGRCGYHKSDHYAPVVGVGASITYLNGINGSPVQVVADGGHVWQLAQGRSVDKNLIGVHWKWSNLSDADPRQQKVLPF